MPPGIADLIRTGRIRKGLNQEDLAQKSGVSRTTLHHIERGTHKPRASTLSRLAKTLEIDPQSLAEGWEKETVSDSVNHSQDRERAERSAFDWSTNLALAAARERAPERFLDFNDDDWDSLASQVGVGGGLTLDGVYKAAEQIRHDRETLARLRLVLQTHLREPARNLIDALYQSVVVETGSLVVPEAQVESTRSE
ncbi:helix-turn-helix domain-containing protein [bacterium]|nr:helix-turn-helix domain-containing protein [bacterium]